MTVNISKSTVLILTIIVAVIVLYSIFGGTASLLSDSGDAITSASNCSSYPTDERGQLLSLQKAVTSVNCSNSTTQDTGLPANEANLPLENLFASNGIVFLVLMASFLLLMIFVTMKVRGKK